MESRFLRASAVTVVTAVLLGACASQVQFPSEPQKLALTGQLHQPDDKSRHPAVILLAPCGGVTSHMGDWARWLNGLGYVTLIVDSQASRGTTSSCEGRGPGTYQVARDAVDALAYLRTLCRPSIPIAWRPWDGRSGARPRSPRAAAAGGTGAATRTRPVSGP